MRPTWRSTVLLKPTDTATGVLATAALVLLLLALFYAVMHYSVIDPDDVHPTIGTLRLLLTFPLLVMFGSLLSARRFIPPGVVAGLCLLAIGLAAWLTFEAASDFHGELPAHEWLEVALAGTAILGILIHTVFSALAGREAKRLEREASERDSLTGLLDRRGLARRYVEVAADQPLTLATLDLNDLKRINDLHGHGAGDAHLRGLARALKAAFPEALAVARLGGDEFAVLAPEGETTVRGTLERLAASLPATPSGLPPFAAGLVETQSGAPLARAFALADASMYRQKEAQRERQTQRTGEVLPASVEGLSEQLERLTTPQAVLSSGLRAACTLLGFDAALFLERRGDVFKLTKLVGTVPEAAQALLDDLDYSVHDGLVSRATAQQTTVWEDDYPSSPAALSAWTQAGLRSVSLTPVYSGSQLIGLIGLLAFRTWRPITPQARRVQNVVALRLSHALERTRVLAELKEVHERGLLALGVALEARDLETAGHTGRVVALAETLGRVLGLEPPELDDLRHGAYLHDLGKLAIPDAVLLKPGKLTPDEWKIMKSHSVRGAEVAARIPGLSEGVLEVIRHHHERWDGRGYPDGLAGAAIPLAARIFAVCDVYDALTSVRPYKPAWAPERALEEIRTQAGVQFDSAVVGAFTEVRACGRTAAVRIRVVPLKRAAPEVAA